MIDIELKKSHQVEQQVHNELAHIWVKNLGIGVVAQIILSIIVYVFFKDLPTSFALTLWLIYILSVSTLALMLPLLVKSCYEKTIATSCLYPLIALVILSGIGWGILSYHAFIPHTLSNQSFIVLAIFAVSAGAITFLSPLFYTYLLFLLPLAIPLEWQLIFSADLGPVWHYLILLYFFVIILSAYITHQILKKYIKLRFANIALTESKSLLEEKISARTQELRRALDLTKAIFESTAEGILVTDLNGSLLDCNARFLDIFSLKDKASVKGHSIAAILKGCFKKSQDLTHLLQKIKNQPAEKHCGELSLNERILAFCVTPYRLNKKVIGNVWDFNDISQHKKLREKLIFQANHDLLTRLPNRRFLKYQLNESLAQAKRLKTKVVLLFIDLDDFKSINDAFGHEIGDKVLKIIAQRMNEQVRQTDFLIRYGGDEFVLFFQTQNLTNINRFAEKIIKLINEPVSVDEQTFNITASIGISIYPKDSKGDEELIKHANIALHVCKDIGANSVKFYENHLEMKPKIYLETQTELKRALKNEELFLQYQPIVNLNTGEVSTVEALLRWRHPQKGLIMPDKFISVAERSGLIHELGKLALKQAFIQAGKWFKNNIKVTIAVNLSPLQIKHPDFIPMLQELVNDTGLKTEFVELEITETSIMENFPTMIKVLEAMHAMGFTLAIDDFGMGYSSLSYLKQFNMDKIKIDKSFIDMIDEEENTSLLEAIIQMGKNLNLSLVAEGVEKEAQLRFLQEYHCDEGQGYLFSPAVDPDVAAKQIQSKFKVK